MVRHCIVITILSIGVFASYSRAQVITTFAGTGSLGYTGDNGLATLANIAPPTGGDFDELGNYYLSGGINNHRIRQVDPSGIITTIAGVGIPGYNGDGSLATSAQFNCPVDIAIDKDNNIYIADSKNYRIRKINATSGIINTIAGNGVATSTGDGGLASQATVIPTGLCFDKLGNLYFTDSFIRVRKIDLTGVISTIAGNGIGGYSGDGGSGLSASIAIDYGICTDTAGNVYIACASRVRKIDVITGIITTYAGNGVSMYNGDGISATTAQLAPRGIIFDNKDNLFISDYINDRIRKVDAAGMISTVAGNGSGGYSGDNVLATMAKINHTEGVTLDTCGNIYIADKNNYRIRKVTFNDTCGQTSTLSAITRNKQLSIYPNPVTSQFTISGENLQSISITNILGQIVYWQKASAEKTVVDMSGLHVGVYFVTVTDKQGVKVTKRVMKE